MSDDMGERDDRPITTKLTRGQVSALKRISIYRDTTLQELLREAAALEIALSHAGAALDKVVERVTSMSYGFEDGHAAAAAFTRADVVEWAVHRMLEADDMPTPSDLAKGRQRARREGGLG